MYRVHPCEWNVGQSAGAVAAHSIRESISPYSLSSNLSSIRRLQLSLIRRGASQLYWWSDGSQLQPADQLTKRNDPFAYEAAQMLAVMSIFVDRSNSSIQFDRSKEILYGEFEISMISFVEVMMNESFVPDDWENYSSELKMKKLNFYREIIGSNCKITSFNSSSPITREEAACMITYSICYASPSSSSSSFLFSSKSTKCPEEMFTHKIFFDVNLSEYIAEIEQIWVWGLLENDISELPPYTDVGYSIFKPTSMLTQRSFVVWIWNALKERYSLLNPL